MDKYFERTYINYIIKTSSLPECSVQMIIKLYKEINEYLKVLISVRRGKERIPVPSFWEKITGQKIYMKNILLIFGKIIEDWRLYGTWVFVIHSNMSLKTR